MSAASVHAPASPADAPALPRARPPRGAGTPQKPARGAGTPQKPARGAAAPQNQANDRRATPGNQHRAALVNRIAQIGCIARIGPGARRLGGAPALWPTTPVRPGLVVPVLVAAALIVAATLMAGAGAAWAEAPGATGGLPQLALAPEDLDLRRRPPPDSAEVLAAQARSGRAVLILAVLWMTGCWWMTRVSSKPLDATTSIILTVAWAILPFLMQAYLDVSIDLTGPLETLLMPVWLTYAGGIYVLFLSAFSPSERDAAEHKRTHTLSGRRRRPREHRLLSLVVMVWPMLALLGIEALWDAAQPATPRGQATSPRLLAATLALGGSPVALVLVMRRTLRDYELPPIGQLLVAIYGVMGAVLAGCTLADRALPPFFLPLFVMYGALALLIFTYRLLEDPLDRDHGHRALADGTDRPFRPKGFPALAVLAIGGLLPTLLISLPAWILPGQMPWRAGGVLTPLQLAALCAFGPGFVACFAAIRMAERRAAAQTRPGPRGGRLQRLRPTLWLAVAGLGLLLSVAAYVVGSLLPPVAFGLIRSDAQILGGSALLLFFAAWASLVLYRRLRPLWAQAWPEREETRRGLFRAAIVAGLVMLVLPDIVQVVRIAQVLDAAQGVQEAGQLRAGGARALLRASYTGEAPSATLSPKSVSLAVGLAIGLPLADFNRHTIDPVLARYGYFRLTGQPFNKASIPPLTPGLRLREPRQGPFQVGGRQSDLIWQASDYRLAPAVGGLIQVTWRLTVANRGWAPADLRALLALPPDAVVTAVEAEDGHAIRVAAQPLSQSAEDARPEALSQRPVPLAAVAAGPELVALAVSAIAAQDVVAAELTLLVPTLAGLAPDPVLILPSVALMNHGDTGFARVTVDSGALDADVQPHGLAALAVRERSLTALSLDRVALSDTMVALALQTGAPAALMAPVVAPAAAAAARHPPGVLAVLVDQSARVAPHAAGIAAILARAAELRPVRILAVSAKADLAMIEGQGPEVAAQIAAVLGDRSRYGGGALLAGPLATLLAERPAPAAAIVIAGPQPVSLRRRVADLRAALDRLAPRRIPLYHLPVASRLDALLVGPTAALDHPALDLHPVPRLQAVAEDLARLLDLPLAGDAAPAAAALKGPRDLRAGLGPLAAAPPRTRRPELSGSGPVQVTLSTDAVTVSFALGAQMVLDPVARWQAAQTVERLRQSGDVAAATALALKHRILTPVTPFALVRAPLGEYQRVGRPAPPPPERLLRPLHHDRRPHWSEEVRVALWAFGVLLIFTTAIRFIQILSAGWLMSGTAVAAGAGEARPPPAAAAADPDEPHLGRRLTDPWRSTRPRAA